MLKWQGMYINLTWNCRVCVGVAFFGLLCAFLPSLITVEWIDQPHLAKTKMGYISLPSNLNAIMDITIYYCIILKMVILHDAIKTIHNGVVCFFKKRTKTCFFKKNKKFGLKKQKADGLFFSKKRVFLNLIVFQPFCDFPLIAWSGTSHVTISLFGCTPHTWSIGPWYWRTWELPAFDCVKLSGDKFRKIKSMQHVLVDLP